jgi:hypothetical protein
MAPPTLRDLPTELVERWDVRSRLSRQHLHDEASAALIDLMGGELRSVMEAAEGRWLNVEQAASRAGRCPSTIRKHLSAGRLKNAGRRYAPRIRLSDLRALYPEV